VIFGESNDGYLMTDQRIFFAYTLDILISNEKRTKNEGILWFGCREGEGGIIKNYKLKIESTPNTHFKIVPS
jgi:hypothetical protein